MSETTDKELKKFLEYYERLTPTDRLLILSNMNTLNVREQMEQMRQKQHMEKLS